MSARLEVTLPVCETCHAYPLRVETSICSRRVAANPWTKPQYSRTAVRKAGRCFVDPAADDLERAAALRVINNWRSAHSYPLNTWQTNLRRAARSHDPGVIVAQRIKRLPSIRLKLEVEETMDLARMQDIGGCRAVVADVETVHKIYEHYRGGKSRVKHRFVREDLYTQDPPASGYRGVHLVYAYNSDKVQDWNGLRIELQIRSRLQHAWATAVETVGTFTKQALKSSIGDAEWLRFFALMSSALAFREQTPHVPNTPNEADELRDELREYATKLDVIQYLNAYGTALRHLEQSDLPGSTFLLELDITERTLRVRSYEDQAAAAQDYGAVEVAIADDPGKDAVLVSVESIETLRRAYPNYFLDTTVFVEALEEAIQ